jgi:hypothetical protein
MTGYNEQWQSLLAELKQRTDQAQRMGGEHKVAAHKAQGHLNGP